MSTSDEPRTHQADIEDRRTESRLRDVSKAMVNDRARPPGHPLQ